MPGPMFRSMSSYAHQAHIALSEPMTSKVQQSSSLGLCPTFPSTNPHFKLTFRSLTLCEVLSGGRQRQIKPYSHKKRWKNRSRKDKGLSCILPTKSGLATLLERRLRSDLIETFQIINGISNYGRHFFSIFPWIGNLLSRQIPKSKSIKQLYIFDKRVTYF